MTTTTTKTTEDRRKIMRGLLASIPVSLLRLAERIAQAVSAGRPVPVEVHHLLASALQAYNFAVTPGRRTDDAFPAVERCIDHLCSANWELTNSAINGRTV